LVDQQLASRHECTNPSLSTLNLNNTLISNRVCKCGCNARKIIEWPSYANTLSATEIISISKFQTLPSCLIDCLEQHNYKISRNFKLSIHPCKAINFISKAIFNIIGDHSPCTKFFKQDWFLVLSLLRDSATRKLIFPFSTKKQYKLIFPQETLDLWLQLKPCLKTGKWLPNYSLLKRQVLSLYPYRSKKSQKRILSSIRAQSDRIIPLKVQNHSLPYIPFIPWINKNLKDFESIKNYGLSFILKNGTAFTFKNHT